MPKMCLAQWLAQHKCSLIVSQYYCYFKRNTLNHPERWAWLSPFYRLRGVSMVQLCSQFLWQISAYFQGQVRCPFCATQAPEPPSQLWLLRGVNACSQSQPPSCCKAMRTGSGSMGSFFAVIPVSSRIHGKSWLDICWPTGSSRHSTQWPQVGFVSFS